jgi:hypothetical protein
VNAHGVVSKVRHVLEEHLTDLALQASWPLYSLSIDRRPSSSSSACDGAIARHRAIEALGDGSVYSLCMVLQKRLALKRHPAHLALDPISFYDVP